MTKRELVDYLVEAATRYRKDRQESLNRNGHLHQWDPVIFISPLCLDAALVDFVNFLANDQGVDLALKRTDLD